MLDNDLEQSLNEAYKYANSKPTRVYDRGALIIGIAQ